MYAQEDEPISEAAQNRHEKHGDWGGQEVWKGKLIKKKPRGIGSKHIKCPIGKISNPADAKG
jgi:hypothetical protein